MTAAAFLLLILTVSADTALPAVLRELIAKGER